MVESLYRFISLESSFLDLDLVGRDNSSELLGLRSNILIQEVVLAKTLKEDSISWNIQVYVLFRIFQLRG